MKKISKKRLMLSKPKIIFILILLIFLNTMAFLFHFTSILGDVLLTTAEKELKEVTVLIVGSNISKERLSRIGVEDLIIANKNSKEEITDIDFKLDVAYEMLLELKDALDVAVLAVKQGNISTKTHVINDNLVLKIPFYAYTNNPLLMNLGPKIYLGIQMIEYIRGSVTTKVTSYGINSVLIDLYLNLQITESILLPTNRESIVLDYEILLASKVIQGKVPNFYPGTYEMNSGEINIE